ncbi:MAG: hypothetical protein GY774_16970 [Planctomycetes bacterium]|nr:hypothetical protein [Planctomycetota bacterium]
MNRNEKTKELLRRSFRECSDGSDLTGIDQRILSDASTSMRKAVAANQRVKSISLWRTIMKSNITKLATAAVVIIAVMVVLNHLGGSIDGSSIVLADVAKKIAQVNSAIWQEHRTLTCDGTKLSFLKNLKTDVTRYYSCEYGSREDMSTTDGLLLHQVYWLTEKNVFIEVAPLFKQYKLKELTETERMVWSQRSIVAALEGLIESEEPAKLGRKIINGKEAEGFEIRDSKIVAAFVPVRFDSLVARFWIDVETSLPVRYEAELVISDKHITSYTGGKSVEVNVTADGFQWNAELEPGVFEPNIPSDYTPMEY